jgi:phosphotransferase system  glucose/maltose/N-acetylglucosamine-specific IIC component|tara:strand:+ start:1583 stop:1774 length:192 start_codon:yes stop_codon:yes gene_type:complete
MNKVGRIFEIGYLFVGVIFGYEAYQVWGEDKSYVYLILMALAVFMFFFRRKFRKKREDRFNQN